MRLPGVDLQSAGCRARGRDVAADEATIAWRLSERASPGDRAERARKGGGRCEHATGAEEGTSPRDAGAAQEQRGRGWDGGRWMQMDGERDDGGRVGRGSGNVPFEFVGEVARAGAVAEARDVERGAAAARHGSMRMGVCEGC
jgi:hypothetical protein